MATTYTPRFGLPQQSDSAQDSPTMAQFNQAFSQVEGKAAIDSQGQLGVRPTPGQAGRFFTDTDSGYTYRDNGTAWVLVGGNTYDSLIQNTAVNKVPLTVQAIAATSAAIQQWMADTTAVMTLDAAGTLHMNQTPSNPTSVLLNDPLIAASLMDNSADTNARGLVVNGGSAFVSTKLVDIQNNGTTTASFDKLGNLVMKALSITNLTASGNATVGGTLKVTGTTELVGNTDVDGNLNVDGFITAQSLPPIGGIIMYGKVLAYNASLTQPWLPCTGITVSRTKYPELFAAIGTTFGAGDGSTTFTLPNMNARFPIGGAAPGTLGGAANHQHSLSAQGQAQIVVSNTNIGTHLVSGDSWSQNHNNGGLTNGTLGSGTAAVGLQGDTDMASTMPPYVILTFLIRAK